MQSTSDNYTDDDDSKSNNNNNNNKPAANLKQRAFIALLVINSNRELRDEDRKG